MKKTLHLFFRGGLIISGIFFALIGSILFWPRNYNYQCIPKIYPDGPLLSDFDSGSYEHVVNGSEQEVLNYFLNDLKPLPINENTSFRLRPSLWTIQTSDNGVQELICVNRFQDEILATYVDEHFFSYYETGCIQIRATSSNLVEIRYEYYGSDGKVIGLCRYPIK